jgi:triosephosphate isomerase
MQRRPLIVGNWKMNGLIGPALNLVEDIRGGLVERARHGMPTEVVLCPPFTLLHPLRHLAREASGVPWHLGAQNMAVATQGAYTGEISGPMLRDAGCDYVILGHSERRQGYGETDDVVARKVQLAISTGLRPIVCVGESGQEREQGATLAVIRRQLQALTSVPTVIVSGPLDWRDIVIAYEPVWAIGTGKHATPEQVQEVAQFLRSALGELPGNAVAGQMRILYGGSVNPSNATALFALPDVDGGLIGGASLSAADFLAIVDGYDA